LIEHWMTATAVYITLAGAVVAESKHCDRACMMALTDQYLAALVKHDPSGLPLSKGVRFTENTAEIRIGDGLWVGASEAPTTFKVYAVDPASNQVGFYGVMKENNRPLIIARSASRWWMAKSPKSNTCWRAIFAPTGCRTWSRRARRCWPMCRLASVRHVRT
jgi:hypothetical protein